MPELDDARSLELIPAGTLAADDVFPFFSGSRNRVVGVTGDTLHNVAEGTPVHAATATKTLAYGATPTNEDTIVITNGTITETYTFMDTPVLPTDIQTEVSVTDALSHAETLISSLSVLVNAEEATADLILTAVTPGAAGNSITVAADTATGDGAFAGGVDATVAGKGGQLFDANYLYTAQTAIAVSSTTGWSKSVIDPL